ncbi:MAG TPA: hypothetical protein DCM86_08650 [Verrucomicrobiales bacterium]|nr:hypothetical protein [Verrucomicrobiales bacterium]
MFGGGGGFTVFLVRLFRKRWRLLLLAGLGPVLFLLVLLSIERFRGWVSLRGERRALVAGGVTFDPRAFAAPPAAPGENGMPGLLAAAKRLNTGVALPLDPPPAMRLTPAGHAVVGIREPSWAFQKTRHRWEEVTADLAANREAVSNALAALQAPVLRVALDYSEGARLALSHLAPTKSLVIWIGASAQVSLRAGDTHEALRALLAGTRLPDTLASDQLVISELVRIAIASIMRNRVWEALQADGWTDQDLARLQEAWEGLHFALPMARALEGEILYADSTYVQVGASHAEAVRLLQGMRLFASTEEAPVWEGWLEPFPYGKEMADWITNEGFCRLWRFAWIDQDHSRRLRQTSRLMEAARVAAAGMSFARVREGIDALEKQDSIRSTYDRWRYPFAAQSPFSLFGVVGKGMRAEAERGLVVTAIALKRCQVRHRPLPESLGELVPEFLKEVPVDPMDGRPLRYRRQAGGGFLLYSVGSDGVDNGGDGQPPGGLATLNSIWERKDAVWPQPALPEEIQAYRAQGP